MEKIRDFGSPIPALAREQSRQAYGINYDSKPTYYNGMNCIPARLVFLSLT